MITQKDREYLRDLAKKNLEYANDPKNKEREKKWYLHNDLKADFPMVTIEGWTFWQEVSREMKCETEEGRNLEGQLVGNLIGREDLDDDRVTPDFYSVWRSSWFLPFGIKPKYKGMKDSIAYQFEPIIIDIEEDIKKLGKSTWGYDIEGAKTTKEKAEDVFGDILPVKEISQGPSFGLTYMLLQYMDMETMMFSFYDNSDELHKILKMITDDCVEYMQTLEEAGFYIPNNGNQGQGQGTYAFTNDLPKNKNGGKVKISDMWAYVDSQETSSVSGEMFHEFFFPYYKQVGDMFGLVNYGCCEPVHAIWDNCLSQYRNLRKVSISPWCDEEFIGERLRGTNTIYHRKPSPNVIAVDAVFDEDAFKKHILKTINAAKGGKLEFSFRDIYSLQGDKGRAKRAVKITKELLESYWK